MTAMTNVHFVYTEVLFFNSLVLIPSFFILIETHEYKIIWKSTTEGLEGR